MVMATLILLAYLGRMPFLGVVAVIIMLGRELAVTVTALADQVAAAADLVAGQGSEGRAVVHVSGLRFTPVDTGTDTLLRPPEQDLYA